MDVAAGASQRLSGNAYGNNDLLLAGLTGMIRAHTLSGVVWCSTTRACVARAMAAGD